jgi:flavin reductase (DIM6/NTAB) family NADH-FMN oxidoreductase RutF
MPPRELPPLAQALGRIPSGLYVVTCAGVQGPIGFLGSFVQQMGLEPPMVAVAVGQERSILTELRQSKRFTLSILDPASRGLMATFVRRLPEGVRPYDALALAQAPSGVPYLAEALAWLDCQWQGEHALADHSVVFGQVLAGALTREGEPIVHLRKNGLSY